jgi:Flp pilus assembly protein TadG
MRRNARTGRKAAAVVELAVLLPFLLWLCVIAADWARLMYFTQCINDCARAGALWASDEEVRMKSRYASVTDAALAEAPGLSPRPTVALANKADANGAPMVEVQVSMAFRTITDFPGVPHAQTLTRAVRARVAPMQSR